MGLGTNGRSRAGGRPSGRELEVLAAAARGMSNRRIAGALSISEATVKRHLANAYEKMGVGSRSEAVFDALLSGLLPADDVWAANGAARFRCVEERCGSEIVVVRRSADPDWREAPRCHGEEMMRLGG